MAAPGCGSDDSHGRAERERVKRRNGGVLGGVRVRKPPGFNRFIGRRCVFYTVIYCTIFCCAILYYAMLEVIVGLFCSVLYCTIFCCAMLYYAMLELWV